MPKGNPGRLKSRFEIRGELVPNEYEFQQHHGEMSEQEHENFPSAEGAQPEGAASPAEQEASRIAEIETRAHEIVERRRAQRARSESKIVAKGGGRGGTKKSAGKKSATKKGSAAGKTRAARGAQKGAAKKNASKKSASKKVATKKSTTKKAAGKFSAKKAVTKKGGKKGAGKSAKAGAGKKGGQRR